MAKISAKAPIVFTAFFLLFFLSLWLRRYGAPEPVPFLPFTSFAVSAPERVTMIKAQVSSLALNRANLRTESRLIRQSAIQPTPPPGSLHLPTPFAGAVGSPRAQSVMINHWTIAI